MYISKFSTAHEELVEKAPEASRVPVKITKIHLLKFKSPHLRLYIFS